MEGGGVRTHRIVVVPVNVGGRLWTLQDDAREIDGATSIDVQVRRTQNLGYGFWKVNNVSCVSDLSIQAALVEYDRACVRGQGEKKEDHRSNPQLHYIARGKNSQ